MSWQWIMSLTQWSLELEAQACALPWVSAQQSYVCTRVSQYITDVQQRGLNAIFSFCQQQKCKTKNPQHSRKKENFAKRVHGHNPHDRLVRAWIQDGLYLQVVPNAISHRGCTGDLPNVIGQLITKSARDLDNCHPPIYH